MSDTIVRIGKALLIHILLGLLALVVIWLMTAGYDDANQVVIDRYKNSEATVLSRVGDARATLVGWAVASFALGLVCASLFLGLAERRGSRGYSEGASLTPTWIILLLVAFVVTTLLWRFHVFPESIGEQLLLAGNYMNATLAVFVLVPLAYYLATGLAVALPVKRSVPGANGLLPRFWN